MDPRRKADRMTQFSATDAAVEGFALAGRKPLAIVVWALASLAVNLAVGVAMVAFAGEAKAVAAALLVVMLFWSAVQTCAVYRAVLRPAEPGVGYLRLGRDEGRMFGLSLLYVALGAGAYLALVIGLAMVIVLVRAAADAAPLAVALGVGGTLALLLAIGWVLVRLSLAGPMTFAEGRIRLWSSWRLTRGHFWALLGAYLNSAILAFAVFVVGCCTALLVGYAVTHEGLGGLYQTTFRPDYASLAGVFEPARLVVLVVQSLFVGLMTAILSAPAAGAYRMIVAARAAPSPAAAAASENDAPPLRRGPWG
jgi:hypothetical protein